MVKHDLNEKMANGLTHEEDMEMRAEMVFEQDFDSDIDTFLNAANFNEDGRAQW